MNVRKFIRGCIYALLALLVGYGIFSGSAQQHDRLLLSVFTGLFFGVIVGGVALWKAAQSRGVRAREGDHRKKLGYD